MLRFFVILLLFVNVAVSKPLASFSLFAPKISDIINYNHAFDSSFALESKVLHINEKSSTFFQLREEIIIDNGNQIDCNDIFSRMLQRNVVSDGTTHKNLLVLNDKFCAISIKNKIIGWNNIIFKTYKFSPMATSKKSIIYLVDPINRRRNIIKIKFHQNGNGNFELLTSCDLRFCTTSRKGMKEIIRFLSSKVKNAIAEEIELAITRKKQIQQNLILSTNEKTKKRSREIDRILHPEKYRSKSPTVRISSDKNTRYRPSAEVQARRQVKRG